MDTRPPPDVPSPAPAHPERPLGELVRSLSRDAAHLVRQEIALARAEMARNARAAARNAVLIAAGGGIALLGGLVLLAALVVAVGDLLGDRYALGALLVGLLLLAIGGGVAFLGVRRARQARLAPEETLATLRETGAWARAQAAQVRAAALDAKRRGSVAPDIDRPAARRPLPSSASREDEEEDERGTPHEDRERAWRQTQPLPVTAPLWKRVLHEFKADDVSNQAAKVAYYFLPSAGGDGAVRAHRLLRRAGDGGLAHAAALRLLPAETSALIEGFVQEVVHRRAPGPLSIGLLLALWAGSNVFTALEDTLNAAFGIRAERPLVKKKAIAVGMLAGCAVLFLGGSAVLVGGGGISDALGLGETGRAVWTVLQWPLGFALITATFWLIYYVLPNKDQRGCRMTLLRASAVSAVLFVAASAAFRLYMASFGSYSRTYGLLGTVIVLLLWMYVTSLVILLGGEVASEMERAG